LEEVGMQISK